MSGVNQNRQVYLIGLGLGAPKYLTARALECLATGKLVIFREGTDPRILAMADPDAVLIELDRQADADTFAGAIHSHLISEGEAVWLEPGVGFSNSDQARALNGLIRQGFTVELVPGVDIRQASATVAGLPPESIAHMTLLVDVDSTHGLHKSTLLDRSDDLSGMLKRLVQDGLTEDQQAYFVAGAATADQTMIESSLSSLSEAVTAETDLRTGVVMIGSPTEPAEQVAWLEDRPLRRQRIVITRAARQAREMVDRMESLGAEVFAIPAIEMAPVDDHATIEQAILDMTEGNSYDWMIFTSANGVDYFFEFLMHRHVDFRILTGSKIAAIGPATEQALRRHGLLADLVPEKYVAEGLLEAMVDLELNGAKVLIPRALEARELLPNQLAARGALVTVAPVYQTIRPQHLPHGAAQLIRSGKITLITFTSSSTVVNWLKILDDLDICLDEALKNAQIACIGPVTAQTARKLGLTVDIEATDHTVDGLIQAILQG